MFVLGWTRCPKQGQWWVTSLLQSSCPATEHKCFPNQCPTLYLEKIFKICFKNPLELQLVSLVWRVKAVPTGGREGGTEKERDLSTGRQTVANDGVTKLLAGLPKLHVPTRSKGEDAMDEMGNSADTCCCSKLLVVSEEKWGGLVDYTEEDCTNWALGRPSFLPSLPSKAGSTCPSALVSLALWCAHTSGRPGTRHKCPCWSLTGCSSWMERSALAWQDQRSLLLEQPSQKKSQW